MGKNNVLEASLMGELIVITGPTYLHVSSVWVHVQYGITSVSVSVVVQKYPLCEACIIRQTHIISIT